MAGVKRGRTQGFAATVLPSIPQELTTSSTGALFQDDLAPVRSFVTNALAMKIRGNRSHYAHIVNTIRTRDDLDTLPRLLMALTSCTTTITADPDKFKDLLAAIFRYDWSGGSNVMEAYRDLIAHLVSANSTFLHPTLQMLARSFATVGTAATNQAAKKASSTSNNKEAHQVVAPAAAAAPSTTTSSKNDNLLEEDISSRYKYIHETLRVVLKLVPAGLSELFPALRDIFPHRRIEGPGSIVPYARQLLLIADYLPNLRDKILGLIVERCLEIDVEIKIDESGEARVSVEDHEGALVLSENVFHNLAAEEGEADLVVDDQEKDAPHMEVDKMADKLDGVMLLLFEYLDRQITSDVAQAPSLFEGLTPTLEGPILSTHRCKYVQFILFYLASRDPSGRVPSLFMKRLSDLAIDDSLPVVARQAALAFLSSYLVRAKSLPTSTVIETLTRLVNVSEGYAARYAPDIMALGLEKGFWGSAQEEDDDDKERGDKEEKEEEDDDLQSGVDLQTPAGMVPGAAGEHDSNHRHTVFYSICQAIFYVVGFHHSTVGGEDILGVQGHSPITSPGGTLGQSLKARLGRLACSPLRPLDQCLESVKREFLRLARTHSLVPPGALVGLGYRCREGSESYPPSSGGPTDAQRHHHQGGGSNNQQNNSTYLDSYFPFDPYILRRSSKFVATEEVYRYWQAVAEVDGQHGGGKEEEEDDDWSARSVTSGDPGGEEEGEEEDGDDVDMDGEEEEGGEDSVVAMSIGSGVGSMYMRQAMGEGTTTITTTTAEAMLKKKKKKKKVIRQKRGRIASMDFADDDYTDGFGGEEVPVGDTSVDDYDEEEDDDDDDDEDEEEDDHGGYDDSGRYDDEGGVEMHGGDIGRVLAMDRIRKESIGSVGSW